jgi:hypothetical protein|tara:strand:+ start:1058 stop:1273 length:216 start_codon:yes stop_codon:yes gene_type:complete
MIEISPKRLSEALALNETKEIYGEEAMYKNNYEEFRGLVMHDVVKETYNKIYNKYLQVILSIVQEKEQWQS